MTGDQVRDAAIRHGALTDLIIDWETKPNSPSAIRLISFGQLLDDNATLKGELILSACRSEPADL